MAARQNSLVAIRAPLPRRTAFLLGFVAPTLVLGAWCVLTYGGLVQPHCMPKPTEVLRRTLQLFINFYLATEIYIST